MNIINQKLVVFSNKKTKKLPNYLNRYLKVINKLLIYKIH